MNKWQFTIAALTVFAVAGILSAADYASGGFTARISRNGQILDLRYQGQPLCSSLQIQGSYSLPEGAARYDARFFQNWDYSGVARISQDGEVMTVTTDSTLGNSVLKAAADYTLESVLAPQKITVRTTVKLKVPLRAHSRIFQTMMVMPPELFGRGVKCTGISAPERFEVIPATYNKDFRLKGNAVAISTPKGILTVDGGKEAVIEFMDSRMWGGNDFSLMPGAAVKWTPEAVEYPAGTAFAWEFTLGFEPEE